MGYKTSLFRALRSAERVIVDGLLVRTFELERSGTGSGILNLEDGSTISFVNQEITIFDGYSAFGTEAEAPHWVDFIMPGNRGLREADLSMLLPPEEHLPSVILPPRLKRVFRPSAANDARCSSSSTRRSPERAAAATASTPTSTRASSGTRNSLALAGSCSLA